MHVSAWGLDINACGGRETVVAKELRLSLRLALRLKIAEFPTSVSQSTQYSYSYRDNTYNPIKVIHFLENNRESYVGIIGAFIGNIRVKLTSVNFICVPNTLAASIPGLLSPRKLYTRNL